MNRNTVVLLLGGEGGRDSGSAKRLYLQPLLGRPLLAFALDAADGLNPEAVLFFGAEPEPAGEKDWAILDSGPRRKAPLFLRLERRRAPSPGPGLLEALRAAAVFFEKYPPGDILAVPADRPLLQTGTLKAFLAAHRKQGCSLTLMSSGAEVGTAGILAFRSADVFPALRGRAGPSRLFGPGALAGLVSRSGGKVGIYECPRPEDLAPVLSRGGLAEAAAALRRRKNDVLLARGVTLHDPLSAWIDWDVPVGPGTVIHPAVVIGGATRVGRGCRIHPFVHIVDSLVGDGVRIHGSTVMEGCVLEAGAQVGPFSRLRPGTRIRAGARVGNFVEMKNTLFGPRSKALHLSYLGDSTVEEDVNVGAGTITCNYDGVSKNPTYIEAGAFIGSGTELVAPVRVGRRSYVAAGSTITRDVGPGTLAVARARQEEKPDWVLRKIRGRKQAKMP